MAAQGVTTSGTAGSRVSGFEQARSSLYEALKLVLGAAMCLTVFAAVIPFTPQMPAAGLDPSWMMGMNHAVVQGLTFGKDLIFNYGPYAFLYTKFYHPALENLTLFASLYFAICYATLLLFLMKTAPLRWFLTFLVVVAGLMAHSSAHLSRDVLFASYALLTAIAVYTITLPRNDADQWFGSNAPLLLCAILFAPLGLLPLIKGSFLLISGGMAVICALMFTYAGRWKIAGLSLLSPVAAMTVFWVLSGQPVGGLRYYLVSMIAIISGYSDAMAASGNTWGMVSYLIVAIGILYVGLTLSNAPLASRLFLFFTFGLFLFVFFKAGFVRHGYSFIAPTASATAAILLAFVVQHGSVNVVVALSLASLIYSDMNYKSSERELVLDNLVKTYVMAFDGLMARVLTPERLRDRYRASIDAIRKEFSIPTLSGTTDIYSFNQAYLLASANTWSPRPVLQSYQANTPGLALLNNEHLIGSHAPDNVIFKVEPIDDRLASLEDGPSWPTLIANYSPERFDKEFLFLRKSLDTPLHSGWSEIGTAVQVLGARYPLPRSEKPLFAELDIRPTLAGRLISFLYKPEPLSISIELADGRKKVYRLPSQMARAGFLISPHVENTREFALLFGNQAYLANNTVRAIEITTESRGSLFWKPEYTLKITSIEVLPKSRVTFALVFDPSESEAQFVGRYGRPVTVNCEGSIDTVNGKAAGAPLIGVSDILSVGGWTAVSAKDGKLPDAVFLTLTDERGNVSFIKTHSAFRPDVAEHFGRPEMRDAGFVSYADVTKLKGTFDIGLSRVSAGRLESCRQWKQPVAINVGSGAACGGRCI